MISLTLNRSTCEHCTLLYIIVTAAVYVSTFAVAVLFPVTFLSWCFIPDSPRRVSLQLSKPVAVTVFLYHSYFQSPVIFYMNFTSSGGASELTLIVLLSTCLLWYFVIMIVKCLQNPRYSIQNNNSNKKKSPTVFSFLPL